MKLSLLTSHASVCNTTVIGFESGHRGERMLNSCVMNRHTGSAPSIMVWGGIGYHSSSTYCRYFKQPALHLRGVGASVLPYLQGLATAIFQVDNA
ncbi:transposable element Tcb1 transposase [Trichonephila clavipes]|nr:transposable element Tcb1 transposase [Trichonephila clavipes]